LPGINLPGAKKIMAKMTKTQLIGSLAEGTGLSKKDVANLMDKLAELGYKETKKAGEFVVPGFGKLVKVARKARMGRNPATGESIKIAAKTVVKFRVAKAVKDAIL
jgi:DNA-binding protein HU-beta